MTKAQKIAAKKAAQAAKQAAKGAATGDPKKAAKGPADKPVQKAAPEGVKRDQFGIRVNDGGHYVGAALVKVSGQKGTPVTVVDVWQAALGLAPKGHKLREPNGILNALRVAGFAVRSGRGMVALTPAGWKAWNSGKPSAKTILELCRAASAK